MDYDVGKQFELMQAKLDYVVSWIQSVEAKKPVVKPVAKPIEKSVPVADPVEEVEIPEEETEVEEVEEPGLFEEAEEVSESPVPIAKIKPVAKKRRWA